MCYIIASDSNLTFTGNTTFLGNSATLDSACYAGGGVGSAIYTFVLNFNGTSNFINNSAGGGSRGGVMWVSENTVLNLSRTNNFINNIHGWCNLHRIHYRPTQFYTWLQWNHLLYQ